MPWNGSGTFNRIFSWVADASAGLDISSSRMDTDTDDIASSGFGNCLTRDGQGQATANLPMAGFRHTGAGLAVATTDYATLGQAQSGLSNWTTAAGTSDVITATYTPAITALSDGLILNFRATAVNLTATPTFRVAVAKPKFNIYYALAHYHSLGTGLELEALMPDDTTATQVFTTSAGIGDSLGGPLDPPFVMAPNTRLKFSCSYYNDTPNVIPWGLGSDEMCVFLAFTDSPYNWGGGVTSPDAPGDPTIVDGVQEFTHPCVAYASTGN